MLAFKQTVKSIGLMSALAASALSFSGAAQALVIDFESGLPAGWTCTGNCGTLGADGHVTASPAGGNYGYVVSNTGITGLGPYGGTDGSRLRSGVFSASAGDDLEVYLNYITPDGGPSPTMPGCGCYTATSAKPPCSSPPAPPPAAMRCRAKACLPSAPA